MACGQSLTALQHSAAPKSIRSHVTPARMPRIPQGSPHEGTTEHAALQCYTLRIRPAWHLLQQSVQTKRGQKHSLRSPAPALLPAPLQDVVRRCAGRACAAPGSDARGDGAAGVLVPGLDPACAADRGPRLRACPTAGAPVATGTAYDISKARHGSRPGTNVTRSGRCRARLPHPQDKILLGLLSRPCPQVVAQDGRLHPGSCMEGRGGKLAPASS